MTLSPSLEEWLEERAATLGVEADELLVQLAGAYRTAADLGEEPLSDFAGVDADTAEDVAELDTRVSDVEAELEESVEDLRNRVLQLRDAVQDSAPEGHSHHEFSKFDARIERVADDVDGVADDVDALSERVTETESHLEEVDEKLTRLARAVVLLRNTSGDGGEKRLEAIRKEANREGVTEARCGACATPLTIGLLTEPACPSCETAFDGLDVPDAGLARTLGFRRPSLSPETNATEGTDDE